MKGWDMLAAAAGTPIEAVDVWASIAPCLTGVASFRWTSQDELLWRLNTRLRGEDPGVPVNWKGLR